MSSENLTDRLSEAAAYVESVRKGQHLRIEITEHGARVRAVRMRADSRWISIVELASWDVILGESNGLLAAINRCVKRAEQLESGKDAD